MGKKKNKIKMNMSTQTNFNLEFCDNCNTKINNSLSNLNKSNINNIVDKVSNEIWNLKEIYELNITNYPNKIYPKTIFNCLLSSYIDDKYQLKLNIRIEIMVNTNIYKPNIFIINKINFYNNEYNDIEKKINNKINELNLIKNNYFILELFNYIESLLNKFYKVRKDNEKKYNEIIEEKKKKWIIEEGEKIDIEIKNLKINEEDIHKKAINKLENYKRGKNNDSFITEKLKKEKIVNNMGTPKINPLKVNSIESIDEEMYSNNNQASRYLQEFDEIKEIGRGGFGSVHKVKNKLDGNFYAVKKITFKVEENTANKVVKEVKLLSKLTHVNIVRYFQSWIENFNTNNIVEKEDSIDIKKNNSSDSYDSNSNINYGNMNSNISYDFQKSSENEEDDGTYLEDDKKILFIQMEFCNGDTLREFIDNNYSLLNLKLFNRLFIQILEVLKYIHDQNLIHRDLKPSNIFLDNEFNIKLGDFGLATQSKNNINNTSIRFGNKNLSKSYSIGIGTPIYSSPEQQHVSKYDKKIDMYSLGIILFELMVGPFKTNSERIRTILELRKTNKIPIKYANNEFLKIYSKLIESLLNNDPKKRPNSKELYEKFKEDFYKEVIIENHYEYKKLINFIFSKNNVFPSGYDFIFDKNLFEKNMKIKLKNSKINNKITLWNTYNKLIFYYFDWFNSNSININYSIPMHNDICIIKFKNKNRDLIPLYIRTKLPEANKNDLILNNKGELILDDNKLILPWSRFISRTNTTNLKSYHFSNYFNLNEENLEFNDENIFYSMIIKPLISDEILFAEIELIHLIDNICYEFYKNDNINVTLYLSHTSYLDLFIENYEVPEENILILLQNINYNYFHNKHLLENNNLYLKKEYHKSILEFFRINNKSINSMNSSLENIFKKTEILDILKNHFKKFNTLLGNLKKLKIKYKPFIFENNITGIFHSGLKFNVSVSIKKLKKKESEFLIINGGRFDNCLYNFLPYQKNDSQNIEKIGIGFKINFIQLRISLSNIKIDFKNIDFYNYYFYIISSTDMMIEEKYKLCFILNSHNCKVKIKRNIITSGYIEEEISKKGVTHIISLKPGSLNKNNKVKLIYLNSKNEEEIEIDNLIDKICKKKI